jgi:hypothetical protein
MHRVDLTFYSPNYASPDDRVAVHEVFVASEAILGEETLDKWIGVIEVTKRPDGLNLSGLDGLKDRVAELVAKLIDLLPDRACYQIGEPTWTMWELHPKERDDYVGQSDLSLAVTMLPEMWTTAHSGQTFYSIRFSRCGETFCYVKMDGGIEGEDEQFGDQEGTDTVLNDALASASVGAVIGGGMGLRYRYFDLALVDVARGCDIVRDILRKRNAPTRSWILFFDSELQNEWIGIWDDTPAPPI